MTNRCQAASSDKDKRNHGEWKRGKGRLTPSGAAAIRLCSQAVAPRAELMGVSGMDRARPARVRGEGVISTQLTRRLGVCMGDAAGIPCPLALQPQTDRHTLDTR